VDALLGSPGDREVEALLDTVQGHAVLDRAGALIRIPAALIILPQGGVRKPRSP
jgi:hypothetical protein